MTLIEKAGLLDKYIRVLKWLKGSSKFKFPMPEVRLLGPDSRPAAAQVVAAAAVDNHLEACWRKSHHAVNLLQQRRCELKGYSL